MAGSVAAAARSLTRASVPRPSRRLTTSSASAESSSDAGRAFGTTKRQKIALVTGSTDGIGLHTASLLAASGHGVIVHGRSSERVDAACERVNAVAGDSGGGVVGSYVRDFDSLQDARDLAAEVLERHASLDLLDNNAGVFEPKRHVTADGHERTFQVNVLTPYLLTGLLLPRLVETTAASGASGGGGGGGAADVRILNVASISQTSKIDFDNLECEKSFSNHASYCHSKTMMKLFSFELYERVAAAAAKGGEPSPLRDVAVLACDPGTVNTKMLLAGWGPCGIETFEANDQFELLTRERFGNASVPESERGGYYVNRTLRETPGGVELEDRKRLWEILERETGVTYPLL